MLASNFTTFLPFLQQKISFYSNFASIFRVLRHNFLAKILYTLRSLSNTNLVKFYVSSRRSKTLHFDGLLLSKSCTVSAKKVQKSYFSWHWTVMQSLKKNWCVVSNMTWGIVWIFTQPPKSLKISLRRALFVESIKVWEKKNARVLSWH